MFTEKSLGGLKQRKLIKRSGENGRNRKLFLAQTNHIILMQKIKYEHTAQ